MIAHTIIPTAFSYNIGSLQIDPTPNELCDAFQLVSRSVTRMSIWPMLQFFFPILRMLVRPCAHMPPMTLEFPLYSPRSSHVGSPVRDAPWVSSHDN